MPRNYDEAMEWPDEIEPDIAEVIHLYELIEDLFEPLDPELPPEDQQ